MSAELHLEQYTQIAKVIVASAQAAADAQHHEVVTPLHVIARLVEMFSDSLASDGLDVHALIARIDAELAKLRKSHGLSSLDARMLRALQQAEARAAREGKSVEVSHVFAAICSEDPVVATMSKEAGISAESFKSQIVSPASYQFASELQFITSGRHQLRALARRTRAALGTSEEQVVLERVRLLLSAIESETTLPDRMPELRASRESGTRLVLSREGGAGTITIEWRAASRSLAVIEQPANRATRMSLFSWRDGANAWVANDNPTRHFFAAITDAIGALYPEVLERAVTVSDLPTQ